MYKIELMTPMDIFSLDLANLDYKTDNYSLNYYLYYLYNHSEDCFKVTSNFKFENSYFLYETMVIGYLIGKHEEERTELHAHVTALSVSPLYRRWKLGSCLMNILENNGNINMAYFVDLFVRSSNKEAIEFYKKNGYEVYRIVNDYYCSPVEDALDMRKSLLIDKEKKYMRPLKNSVRQSDLNY